MKIKYKYIGFTFLEEDEKLEYLFEKQVKQGWMLKNNGMIINRKYSLTIYYDLKKLIGYKKFLDMDNNQIKNEKEYLYALLFALDVDKLDLYPQLMMPAYNPIYTSR